MAFWANFKRKMKNFFTVPEETNENGNKPLMIEGEEVTKVSDLKVTTPVEEVKPMEAKQPVNESEKTYVKEVVAKSKPIDEVNEDMMTSEQEVESEKDKLTKQRAILIKPRYSKEAKIIAQRLMENNIVILNLEEVSPTDFERIRDFVSGTLFSLKGDYRKVSKNVAVLLPSQKVDEDYLVLVLKKVHQLIEKNRNQQQ